MASKITSEIINRISEAAVGNAIRGITLAYALLVQAKLNEAKPPRPKPGSMRFVSEKQRRFVMASINDGRIKVPYVRGTGGGIAGSETLNRSYRVDLYGDEAVLTSSAAYAPYVVGDQQAAIHQGRWKTTAQAVDMVKGSGDLDYIVQRVFDAL